MNQSPRRNFWLLELLDIHWNLNIETWNLFRISMFGIRI
jgi:hypothetical protein